MARRRRIQGRPLLVASTAAAMVIGCSGVTKQGPPPGNLMPPPMVEVEVCVDTVPETATVSAPHQKRTFGSRCETLEGYEGQTSVLRVEAAGYGTEEREFVFEGPKVELKVELLAVPLPPPTGNLMPPPPIERPVGNLMPPPDLRELKPAPGSDE